MLSFAAGGNDVVFPQIPSGNKSIFSRFAEKIEKADEEHKIKSMTGECMSNPSRQHHADALQRVTNEFFNLYQVPMLTIKLDCCKMPKDAEIATIWRRNIFKVLNFLKLTEVGVQGYVKDASGNPLHDAKIYVENEGIQLEYPVTQKLAHFRIVLPPGEVNIRIRCRGFAARGLRHTVNDGTVVDLGTITMEPGNDGGSITDRENEKIVNVGGVVKGKLNILSRV